jgi:hypothetical protein
MFLGERKLCQSEPKEKVHTAGVGWNLHLMTIKTVLEKDFINLTSQFDYSM